MLRLLSSAIGHVYIFCGEMYVYSNSLHDFFLINYIFITFVSVQNIDFWNAPHIFIIALHSYLPMTVSITSFLLLPFFSTNCRLSAFRCFYVHCLTYTYFIFNVVYLKMFSLSDSFQQTEIFLTDFAS